MKLLYYKIQRLIISTRYLSILKIVNWLKLFISYVFSSSKLQLIQNTYPNFISVETSNFCNLSCPECPVGMIKISKTKKTTFNYDLYLSLIDELKPTLLHVILYFQGEPFLNNQLIKLIKHTHDAKIYSSTSTNGQFLNRNIAKEIVLSGLDKLIVSIDGSTQRAYEIYRVGGSLQKAIDGIKAIIDWKRELKSVTPFVEIQFLVLKTNEHQIYAMKDLARSLRVDRLTFKTAQLYDYENGSKFLTSIERYARYKKCKDWKIRIKGSQPNRCWRLWSGAVINVKGEVLPCCFDKFSEYSFGNILDNTFSNCWQSKVANNFRLKLINNRKQFEMCRNCTS